LQDVEQDLPPCVLDMHVQDTNMQELFFAFSGPEDTPHHGGMCVLRFGLRPNVLVAVDDLVALFFLTLQMQ
jgi:hypothetical protein